LIALFNQLLGRKLLQFGKVFFQDFFHAGRHLQMIGVGTADRFRDDFINYTAKRIDIGSR
jgi:hypothetical protein